MQFFRSPRALIFTALLLGFALRLPVLLCEEPIGRDLQEYLNIAKHLREGEGFTLSIKAYHAVETPVVHHAIYDRPPLLAVLYAWLGLFLSDRSAVKLLGTLCFLIAAGFAFDLVRRFWGPRAGWLSSMLLLLHPGLFGASIRSETEAVVILLVVFALWARFAGKSAGILGMAVALLFLSRPNAIVPGALIIASFWGEPAGRRRMALSFAVALLGPILLIATNLVSGAPAFVLPQSFLFRELSFQDQLHYFHRAPVYGSTAALLADNATAVVRLIAKNAFHYGRLLFDPTEGAGFFIVIVPIAWAYLLRRSPARRLAFVMLAIAVWEFAFHTLIWSTFASRFLAVPLALLAIGTPAGIVAWDPELKDRVSGEPRSRNLWLLLLPVLVISATAVAYQGFIALRELQLGRPLSNYMEPVWTFEGVDDVLGALPARNSTEPSSGLVVASNEPWLVSRITGQPSVLLPWDLEPAEWMPFLKKYGANAVFIHEADWPAGQDSNRRDLTSALKAAGWRFTASAPRLALWIADPAALDIQ